MDGAIVDPTRESCQNTPRSNEHAVTAAGDAPAGQNLGLVLAIGIVASRFC